MRTQRPRLHIFADAAAVTQFAAERITTLAHSAVAGRNRFTLALAGGGTPLGLYKQLAAWPARDYFPWPQTHIFWGDERCVPPDDSGSNYYQARRTLLDHVPVPRTQVHRIPGELEPHKAAGLYTSVLRRQAEPGAGWPRLDVVLLGMGRDGHTASLFPGTIAPEERTSAVMVVTADYDDRPAQRISLTPRVFNDAQHVIFLVTGADKAPAVKEVLAGKYRPKELPAQRIRPRFGTLTWLLDEAAAAQLEQA